MRRRDSGGVEQLFRKRVVGGTGVSESRLEALHLTARELWYRHGSGWKETGGAARAPAALLRVAASDLGRSENEHAS